MDSNTSWTQVVKSDQTKATSTSAATSATSTSGSSFAGGAAGGAWTSSGAVGGGAWGSSGTAGRGAWGSSGAAGVGAWGSSEINQWSSHPVPPVWPSRTPYRSMPEKETNLIRQIADAVAGLARSVTATFAGTPDNIPVNNVGRTNRDSNHTAEDEYKYDARKWVVGSERTYCRNCRRYHHALVSL